MTRDDICAAAINAGFDAHISNDHWGDQFAVRMPRKFVPSSTSLAEMLTDFARLVEARTNREVLAIVEKMPHASECHGLPHCGLCGNPPWVPTHKSHDFRYLHAFEPGECNCLRGELLSKLGELK